MNQVRLSTDTPAKMVTIPELYAGKTVDAMPVKDFAMMLLRKVRLLFKVMENITLLENRRREVRVRLDRAMKDQNSVFVASLRNQYDPIHRLCIRMEHLEEKWLLTVAADADKMREQTGWNFTWEELVNGLGSFGTPET